MKVRCKFTIFSLVAAIAICAGQAASQQLNKEPDALKPPSGIGACSPQKSCADLAPAMIQSAEGPSPLAENLRHLTDEIGGRVSGSPAADKAVGWGVEAFRHAGVDDVHTEKFTIPVGWSEGNTRADVISPVTFSLHLVSVGWSPALPEGGITAEVVDVGDGDAAAFAKVGAAAKDAIVLVHTKVLVTWDDLMNEYRIDSEVLNRAKQSGATAVFWMGSRNKMLLYRHNSSISGELEPMPQAIVAREEAQRLARFLANNVKVRVHFELPNKITGPVQSENVVAEIRGREKPDEFVLLGAHLDSWELGTGALDNGCNAAMVIDAARVIHASGNVPRRSIRFVLFTGEEQGMLGSWAYARAHRAELNHMDAAIIYDSGNGRVTGYTLSGRKDVEAEARRMLAPLKSLGADDFTYDIEDGTDSFDFMLEGVPTLVGDQDPANYMENYHSASDTYDKVDMPELKKHVAIAAITAFAIADDPERLGPRQSRQEIEAMFKAMGFDKEMQDEGFGALWNNGSRGRQP